MTQRQKIELGRLGEDMACEFLKSQRYKIIERNVKTRFGEIDLIAKDKGCLCFIEVKTRENFNFGPPEESITRAKRAHMIKAAFYFLNSNKIKFSSTRFDVVSVTTDGKIDIIKNAFSIE